MGSTSIPPEADLKNYVTYHVLLMLREGLWCAYDLARGVVKAGGEFRVFRDSVVGMVSRKLLEAFSRVFAGPRLSYCLRAAEEVAISLVNRLFGYGSRPLVYEENTKCMSSVAEVIGEPDYLEERHYEELKSGYVRVAREILAKFADAKLVASLSEIARASLRARYSWITRVGSRISLDGGRLLSDISWHLTGFKDRGVGTA